MFLTLSPMQPCEDETTNPVSTASNIFPFPQFKKNHCHSLHVPVPYQSKSLQSTLNAWWVSRLRDYGPKKGETYPLSIDCVLSHARVRAVLTGSAFLGVVWVRLCCHRSSRCHWDWLQVPLSFVCRVAMPFSLSELTSLRSSPSFAWVKTSKFLQRSVSRLRSHSLRLNRCSSPVAVL